ncbi:MAG: hypothetical protein GY833_00085, partial [Aestuariibacter sp.]|nr:hypothetical protein [Aestuariibacter sp.]
TDQAGNGKSPESPLATWDYADNLASDDDLIYLMENHVETVASAGAISLASGARTIGLGQGTNRPTFTFSATASTITVTAANTEFTNIILVPSIDSVVSPIVVSAANCSLKFEVQDASASIEFVRAVLTTAAADNLTLDIVYRGFVAGNACVNAVRLVGGDNIKIGIEF